MLTIFSAHLCTNWTEQVLPKNKCTFYNADVFIGSLDVFISFNFRLFVDKQKLFVSFLCSFN